MNGLAQPAPVQGDITEILDRLEVLAFLSREFLNDTH